MAGTSETVRTPSSSKPSRPFQAILAGGAIAGILDLAYAILVYTPHHPILIPQTIASGLLGAKSYDGGAATAVLGVALHFLIAFTAAAVYCFASLKIKFLTRRAIGAGLIYGAIVYVFMHAVVLPLSAVPNGHMPLIYKICEFIEHGFFVGLPIALSARRYTS